MKDKTKSPLVIVRLHSGRFKGLSDAARSLGVSRQAVANYAHGVNGAISADKAARIEIKNESKSRKAKAK